jgi:hypothetical protein
MSKLSTQSVNRYGINVEGGQNVISGNTFNLSLPPLEPMIDGPPNNLAQ